MIAKAKTSMYLMNSAIARTPYDMTEECYSKVHSRSRDNRNAKDMLK
jgi:hypothetical protein